MRMFNKLKQWTAEKKKGKMFKYFILIIVLIALSAAVNFIDFKKGGSETSESEQEESAEENNPKFHIGAGHVVMLVLLVGAYGIDRIIVFRNKLEEDKKYNNFKEEK